MAKGRGGVRVAMVALEASGDRLAAGLINAIQARAPGSSFTGVGGPKMAAAGCELLFEMGGSGVIGLDGLVRELPRIFRMRRRLLAHFTAARPDIFIGVDAPDFNLTLERKLKRRGITCVHYVSPTVWAWRGYRIHKIRRSIHHLLALFPFEADYYRARRVPVTCVGHPMADEIAAPDRAAARRKLRLADGLLIALLPGSRRGEIRRLGRVFMDAARQLLARHPCAQFILPFADSAAADEFHRTAGDVSDLPLRTLDGNARLALEACDIAILASGTAALEAALLRRPHIVAYKLPAFSYWLMRRLRRVDYYSMPNQLLPAPLIPELIQRRATAAAIADEAAAMLAAPARVAELARHFAAMHRDLKRGANARAAAGVLALATA